MILRSLLILSFFLGSVFASLGIDPALLSSGSVNVISGEYCEQVTDMVVRCAEPIALQRYYIGGEVVGKGRGRWHLFREELVVKEEGDAACVDLYEGDGTVLSFSFEDQRDKKNIFERGWSSGKTTLNLPSFALAPGDDEGMWGRRYDTLEYNRRKTFILNRGNQEVRVYKESCKRSTKEEGIFLLQHVVRPNGNQVFYTYDKEDRLIKIHSTDSKGSQIFGSIEITYSPQQVIAKGSDGQLVSYDYMWRSSFKNDSSPPFLAYTLQRVLLPGGKIQKYGYDTTWNADYLPFSLIQTDQGGIAYWWRGWNRWGQHKVKLGGEGFQLGRVRCQTAKGGDPLYSYFYYRDTQGGHTDIVDGNGHLETHYYTDYGRLDAVATSNGWTRYFWDDQNGQLALKGQFDSGGKRSSFASVVKGKKAWAQNCYQESLLGNHTGISEGYLEFEGDKCVDHGLETLFRWRKYLDNTVLVEKEANETTTIHYTYKKGTNLVASKLIYDKTSSEPFLRKREFYQYKEGFLVESISDNGSSKDPDSHEGITEKTVTKIALNCDCLPEVIELHDLEGLLSKRVLHYNSHNLVIQEDHYGADGVFAYSICRKHDEAGRIIEESDPLGCLSFYTYDDRDHITSLTQGGVTTTYTYDREGRCVEIALSDGKDRIVTEKSIYDSLGNKVVAIDALGRETRFSYDGAGNPIEIIVPPTRVEGGAWISGREKRVYNELGHLIQETGPDRRITQYKRTSRGDPYHILDPDGNEERFEYTLAGFLAKHILPTGAYTLYERDTLGRECSTATYSPEGELLFQTFTTYKGSYKTSYIDGEGHEAFWRYNRRGQLIEERQGKGRTTFRYDPLGRIAAKTEWYGEGLSDGITTVWEYDLLSRPISERKLNGCGEILSHSETEYSIRGEPIRKTTYHNGKASIFQKSYDLLGRQIEEIDPLGQKRVTKWLSVTFEGQPALMQKTWDPNNQVTEITHIGQDSPILEEVRSLSGLSLSKVERWFTIWGDKVLEAYTNEGPSLSIHWTYNRKGQLAGLQEAYRSKEERMTRYFYNRFNHVERVVKPSGAIIHYTYDCLGRLLTSQGDGFSYSYTYDRNGQVLTAGGTKRIYSGEGQMVGETFEHGFSLCLAYDGLGRCIEERLHDGSKVQYTYGAHLEQINRINPAGLSTYAHLYLSYNQLGQPTRSKTLFGEEIFFSYDLLGRCVETQSAPYYEVLRHFDPVGNLLSRLTRDYKETDYLYSYTSLNQLESESGFQSHSYSYDSLHNRKKVDSKPCTYNLHNQLLSDGTHHYTYDFDGRLIKIEGSDEVLELTYDGLDRLTSVKKEAQSLSFTYDAFNRRISKEVELRDGSRSKLYFLYEGDREIGACDERGNILQFRALGYGQGAEVGAAVSIELDGEVYAPIHDHKGSVVALVDGNHRLAESYRYTAFGECEVRDAAHRIQEIPKNPYRFSSKRCDEETGLIYFGERYYAPNMGCWITPDPLGFIDGPNLYTFLTANPLLHLDLWGLSKKKKRVIKIVAIVATAIITAIIAADQADRVMRQAAHGNGQLASLDNWEKHHPDKSQVIVSGQDPPGTSSTSIINGINTPLKGAISNADYLKEKVGAPSTVMVYNATGGALVDFAEALLGLFGVQTPAVKRLHEAWDASLKGNNETILQVAHSQGCIHVRNALTTYNHDARNLIQVVAIAPAAYIHKSICKDVMHYCSSRDLVPRLDFIGRERCKGYTKIIPGEGNGMNHSFQHPMYLEYLQKEIKKFYE